MTSLRSDLLTAKIKRLALNEQAPFPTYQQEVADAWKREVERVKAWRESLRLTLVKGERNE